MNSTTSPPTIFIHIVTFQNAEFLPHCLDGLSNVLKTNNLGKNITIGVTDNNSSDTTQEILRSSDIITHKKFLSSNLGFCGGHNIGVATFLTGSYDYLLILNPDVRLHESTLSEMLQAFKASGDSSLGMVTPKLLRSNEYLSPLSSPIIDSTGIVFDASLRHFDRGSNANDVGQYETPEQVAGGTGACLLIRRQCVIDLLLPRTPFDTSLFALYPQLSEGISSRPQLFDEAFFAYREDADLAWRASTWGWKCLYVPTARVFHRRRVTPERRKELPPMINKLGVRNRFLLQISHFDWKRDQRAIIPGFLIRNLIVILGVLFSEQTSLSGLWEVWQLRKRALFQRRLIRKKAVQKRAYDIL